MGGGEERNQIREEMGGRWNMPKKIWGIWLVVGEDGRGRENAKGSEGKTHIPEEQCGQ